MKTMKSLIIGGMMAFIAHSALAEEAYQVTAKAWTAMGEKNWAQAVELADKAIAVWAPQARKDSDNLTEYPGEEEVEKYANLNEIGTLLWIKGEALRQKGDKKAGQLVTGQGSMMFTFDEELTAALPEEAKPHEGKMHGGFNEDPETGIVYTAIPGYGFASISADLTTWTKLGDDERLLDNVHGLVFFTHNGKKLLALSQNRAARVLAYCNERQIAGCPESASNEQAAQGHRRRRPGHQHRPVDRPVAGALR